MTIAQVGSPSIATPLHGGGSISVTRTGVTAGNLLVAVVSIAQTTSTAQAAITPTDTNGTWADAGSSALSLSSGFSMRYGVMMGYQKNCSAGSHTVTYTFPNANTYAELSVSEWSGVDTTAPFDSTVTGRTADENDNATTPVTVGPTSTLSQANNLIVGGVALLNPNTGVSNCGITDPSGYTRLHIQIDSGVSVAAEHCYQTVASTSGVSASWAWTDTGIFEAYGMLAVFKELFVAPPPPAPAIEQVGSRRERPGRGPYSHDKYLRPEETKVFGRVNWGASGGNESVAANDSAIGFNTLIAPASDAVSATESALSALALPVTATDAATLGDSTLVGFSALAADSITVLDFASTFNLFLTEIEKVGDRRNRPGRGPYSMGQFHRQDVPAVFGRVLWGAGASEAATATDAADTTPSLDASDAVSATDSATGLLVMLVNASDTANPSEIASSTSPGDLTAQDSANPTDSSNTDLAIPVLAVDFVTTDDSATPGFVFTALATDAAPVIEGATAYLVVSSAALEALSALDTASSLGAQDVAAEDGSLVLNDAAQALLLSLIGSTKRTVYVSHFGRWVYVSPSRKN